MRGRRGKGGMKANEGRQERNNEKEGEEEEEDEEVGRTVA